jgi:hypothetical protein
VKPKSACPGCQDEQPGGYHMIAMHMEALALTKTKMEH